MEKTNLFIGDNGEERIDIDAQKVVTGRTCVIAQSGAGKSYLIAVLCEELLKNNVPFCIIDTEGEYFSLREKYNLLWVGGRKSDINIEKTDFGKLAHKVIEEGVPMIFDVSDVLNEKDIVSDFANNLYKVADELRTPYLLMVEEADKFVPQSKQTIKKIEEISRRGRKRGLGLLLATQRPALVNKNVLSQCGNQLIGKLTTENDLQAVNLFFGSRKELEELPELEPGEFFVMGDVSKKKTKVKIRERVTKHKGLTPILIPKRLGKISFKELILKTPITPLEEPDEKQIKIKSMKPKINKGQALELASPKRKKAFLLFGKKEDIRFVELQLHPLVYVELKSPEGLIKKKYKRYSFILDGLDGEMVDISRGFRSSRGFSDLIGLNEAEVKVLLEIVQTSGLTLNEMRDETKMSLKNLRAILKRLEKKNLVDYSKKEKIYVPLTDVSAPNIKKHQTISVSDTKLTAKPIKVKIKENNIREILSATDPDMEILDMTLFYYPIYAVHFERRIINIDAITGREI